MQLLRLFLYAFGGIFLLSLIAIARQVFGEHLSRSAWHNTLRGSIEGWLLFVAAMALLIRWIIAAISASGMPRLANGWVVTYGACCAVYLAAKIFRSFRMRIGGSRS